MPTNELHLDERTYARAKRLAEERNVSVEEIVSEAVARLGDALSTPAASQNIIGAFSDCADLLDEIVEEAYHNRERHPLRLKTG